MFSKPVFIGSKSFGLASLKVLHDHRPQIWSNAITFNDTSDSRSVLPEFITECKARDIALVIAKNPAQLKSEISKSKPDLCFVNGWYWLFDAETLVIPKYGFIGVHHSLLPKYRGGAPVVWAMINGERKIGSSIFKIGEKMDDGDLFAQYVVNISKSDYIADVLEKLSKKVLTELPRLQEVWLKRGLKAKPQSKLKPSYCGLRTPEDGLIDWSLSGKRIWNFIRAQSYPYPGAYTYVGFKKIHITKARELNQVYFGSPGQVLQINDKKEVYVSCGEDTAISIAEVKTEDGPLPAHKILNSIRLRLGPMDKS